jgi:hypothetical protein
MPDEPHATTPQLRLVSGWTRYPDLGDEPEHFPVGGLRRG